MKKRMYLYRLSILVIMVLFVPIMFFFLFFWQRSFDEMKKNNEVYYQKIAESFMDDFGERVAMLQDRTRQLIAASMERNSVFFQGSKIFEGDDYWYTVAIRELSEHYLWNEYGAIHGGLYYYSNNRIISQYTYSPEQYFYYVLDTSRTDSLSNDFFDEANYIEREWIYSTTNHDDVLDGALLMGYCTRLGGNRDKTLFFYVFDKKNFGEMISVVYGGRGIDFYILNKETNEVYLALGDQTKTGANFIDNAKYIEEQAEEVYRVDSGSLPLSFIVHIREDSLQNNVMKYYRDMRIVLLVTAVCLIGICLLVIYLAYRPVHELTAELDYSDGNEFDMIRSILNERGTRIYEQEMLIMDLLIKHLVYGVPISEKRLANLGVTAKVQHYSVLVLEGYVLLASEMERISEEMNRLHARVFATNWQGEKKSVLILFMEENNIEVIVQALHDWLTEHVATEYTLLVGKMVEKVDDIRSSFLSCDDKMKGLQIKDKVSDLNPQGEKQKKLKKDILAYLEIHYRDEDLSQTKVADEFQISNYMLSRVFKNQVGIGFAEYVSGKRLDMAKELLLTTSHSVREIALMVGISNEKYFFKVFKTSVGMTPTEFREQE